MARILVVDDEQSMLEVLAIMLKREGYEVAAVSNGNEAMDLIQSVGFDVVITDLKMEPVNGMEVLRFTKSKNLETVVIMMTAHGTEEIAVEAMKEGAFHYVKKPFKMEELRNLIAKGLENRDLKQEVQGRYHVENIVGSSREMQKVFRMIEKVAPTDSTVLIYGESGTGKELVARALHYNSHRRNHPFEPINCTALPETLLESELFGHMKGSFTGAHADKKGLFESANKGSVFLDEIGIMSSGMQMKLLRVLQEKEIKRVGDNVVRDVDVRIIAATNENLSEKVKKSEFREDLFYRLSVIPINLPPLRERREDIVLLVRHFLKTQNKRLKADYRMSDEAMTILEAYEWRGNVREVENVIERAVTLCESDIIKPEDLPEAMTAGFVGAAPRTGDLEYAVLDYEYRHIKRVLSEVGDDKKAAARILGISVPTIYRKLKEFEKRFETAEMK
jgi:DNA-binding NtrC family response regulator